MAADMAWRILKLLFIILRTSNEGVTRVQGLLCCNSSFGGILCAVCDCFVPSSSLAPPPWNVCILSSVRPRGSPWTP